MQEGNLTDKDWRDIVDKTMEKMPLQVYEYEGLDSYQIFFVQTVKKYYKRIKNKNIWN